MIIVGVDPGSRKTGYGVISVEGNRCTCLDFGAIQTAKGEFAGRLKEIYAGLTSLFARFNPGAVAIEEIFHAVNPHSALMLGQSRGVALLAAAQHGIPIAEYTALQIKKAVVGYGKADKLQVQMMVRRLLNLRDNPEPLDASDALAIALCHAFNRPPTQRSRQHSGCPPSPPPSGSAR
jgi:crossover junction endodeoxyribonuclease RuvC